jgi:hypothetical protein
MQGQREEEEGEEEEEEEEAMEKEEEGADQLGGVAGEGRHAAEKLEENDAERPPVHSEPAQRPPPSQTQTKVKAPSTSISYAGDS